MKMEPQVILKYFSITFLWSWVCWSIPIMFGLTLDNVITLIFFALGGIAPSATGILCAYLKRDREYLKDFRNRILDFSLIDKGWYLIIFSLIPVTTVLGIGLNFWFTGALPQFTALNNYLSNPLALISFAVLMLINGPIVEEIGWRGFALDHLERKYNWVISSIILASFWALWHWPLFLIKGTYQYGLLKESLFLFLDFNLQIYALSIIMDWIYHNNRRSILSGILVHFCVNFFGEIFDLPGNAMMARTIVQILVAITILAYWKGKGREIKVKKLRVLG